MRFNNIQLVVFDIAGTTVKDSGSIAVAFKDAMAEKGYDIPVEKINPLMGYKKTEAIKLMLDEYESDASVITEEYINGIHERFTQLMVNYYETTTDLAPQPGAEKVFGLLKQEGIKIGLDTGFYTAITDVIVRRLGWLENGLIDYVVCSNEVPAGRPAPFMIRKMMAEAGVTDANNVVKIGDTEVDVNEGKNAGCRYSIGITTGAFTRSALEPYEPTHIIDHLEELIPILEQ